MDSQVVDDKAIKPASLRQPDVKPLTLDNIRVFGEKANQRPLTTAQLQLIEQFINRDKPLNNLSKLLNEVIEKYSNYEALAGLSSEETKKLRELINTRNEFKKNHQKGEYDFAGFKQFIANEHKIVSFNKSVEWWETNIKALKKLYLWEEIITLIEHDTKEQKLPEQELQNRLHKLADIKFKWSKHQMFATFSSENLLSYEENYLAPMEKSLLEFLSVRENLPAVIREYLSEVLYNIHELHKQAIYSMIARLECMESEEDIENDDILYDTIFKIEKETNVDLKKDGKRPLPRRGFTPEAIKEMLDRIKNYTENNPSDRSMMETVNKLNVATIPFAWRTFNSEVINRSQLANNPTLIFSANKLAKLIKDAMQQRDIHIPILEDEEGNPSDSILWQIKRMLDLANIQLSNQNPTADSPLDTFIREQFDKWGKEYQRLIKEIEQRISIEIRNSIQLSVENIFSDDELEHSRLTDISLYLVRANEFSARFSQLTYDPDQDVILAISTKFKQLIEKNIPITQAMFKKMGKLLLIGDTVPNNIKLDRLLFIMIGLPEYIKNVHDNDDPYIMHLVTHHIELPLLTHQSIETALKRHEYIANLYERPWPDLSKIKEPQPDEINKSPFFLYIEFVIMPLLQKCPSILLENFDASKVIENIIYLAKQVQEKKSPMDMPVSIRNQFEAETLKKLNKLFDARQYLLKNDGVDTQKLISLNTRIKGFFSNKVFQENLLKTIRMACITLIKSYLIKCIQTDIDPDLQEIELINLTLNTNILNELANDSDISTLLVNYIELYNGTTNNIGKLLAAFSANKNIQHENVLHHFASKRLNYISAAKNVTQNDYEFFDKFKNHPAINKIYKQHQGIYAKRIPGILTSNAAWEINEAGIIELFGTKEQIEAYRFKRLKELLNDDLLAKTNTNESHELFNHFYSTINQHIMFSNKIVSSKNLITNDTALNTYLDYATNSKPWTPLLESIISTTGSTEQLQTLHYRTLLQMLNAHNNIEASELGQAFISIGAQTSNQDVQHVKNQYVRFFGEKNIKQLCAQIEKMLTNLQKVSDGLSKDKWEIDDYKLHMTAIYVLRKFEPFFMLNSNVPEHQKMMRELTDLEHKIQLHQALQTTLKQQTSLLSLASEDTSLHNLLLELIKNIIHLQDNRYITSMNITHFIRFCNTEILDKINRALDEKNISLTVLMTFMDLLAHLPSNNLKAKLIKAHREAAIENPAWLMLINHLDESDGRLAVTSYLSDSYQQEANLGVEFTELMDFSQKIVLANQRLRFFIKKFILNEIGIAYPTSTNISLHNIISDSQFSDTDLLEFWRATIQKCISIPNDQSNVTSLEYLINQAVKVGEEILKRSKNNSTLLMKFMDSLLLLSDPYKKQIMSTENKRRLSLWANPVDNTLAPLFNMAERALIAMIIQTTEKFVLKYIPNEKLDEYRRIVNDPIYLEKKTPLDKLSQALDKIIYSQKANASAKMLAYTVSLCQRAELCLANNKQLQSLIPAINELNDIVQNNSSMRQNKYLTTLVSKLKTIAELNPLLNDDHNYVNKSGWSRIFRM